MWRQRARRVRTFESRLNGTALMASLKFIFARTKAIPPIGEQQAEGAAEEGNQQFSVSNWRMMRRPPAPSARRMASPCGARRHAPQSSPGYMGTGNQQNKTDGGHHDGQTVANSEIIKKEIGEGTDGGSPAFFNFGKILFGTACECGEFPRELVRWLCRLHEAGLSMEFTTSPDQGASWKLTLTTGVVSTPFTYIPAATDTPAIAAASLAAAINGNVGAGYKATADGAKLLVLRDGAVAFTAHSVTVPEVRTRSAPRRLRFL